MQTNDDTLKLSSIMEKVVKSVFDWESHNFSPSEWAANKRVLSTAITHMAGLWSHDETPYLVEIMDNFGTDSEVLIQAIMKATRMGFTTGVTINISGWVIDAFPSSLRILIPNADTLKSVFVEQLNDMLISSGLDYKIAATNQIGAKKRTGSTTFEKHFHGGSIVGQSLNSESALVSYAAHRIIIDEADESFNSAGADDKFSRVLDRASTYGDRMRVCVMSMPADKNTSMVYKLFLEGDQRYWYVPCPFCQHYQRMRWQDDEGNFGFVYQTDDEGRIIDGSVAMLCANPNCGATITDGFKYEMIRQGEWRSTAVAKRRKMRSYQISALYSNFRTWTYIAEQWVLAQGDLRRMQSFVRSLLGEPWEDRQTSNLWRKLQALNSPDNLFDAVEHRWNDVQLASIGFITMGVDVQKDYLEVQIVGWAAYDMCYDLHHFQVRVDAEDSDGDSLHSAFIELAGIIDEDAWGCPYLGDGDLAAKMTGIRIERDMVIPEVIFVDSGSRQDLVFKFCTQFEPERMVFPSRGQNSLKNDQYIIVKPNQQVGVNIVYLDTNLLKGEIVSSVMSSSSIDIKINIHKNRDHRYYQSLLSEYPVERNGKTYWEKLSTGRRNEVLDCFVMARGALWYIATQAFHPDTIDWDALFSD